jgi:hypothetical protein
MGPKLKFADREQVTSLIHMVRLLYLLGVIDSKQFHELDRWLIMVRVMRKG